MKKAFILLLAVLLVSCHKHESKNIELIAYYWSRDEKQNRDTIIPYVRCYIYAQINENGECILNIKNKNTKNQFSSFNINNSNDTYKKDKSHDFKINKEIIKEVFDLVNKANSDTSLIERKDTNCYIYDGPSISIFGRNNQGKQVRLKYLESHHSNLCYHNLFNYLNSKEEMSPFNSRIDTTKILQAKERLVKSIYKTDIGLLPKFRKSIRFVPPVIKKDYE
jgi:hypothetical protein